MKNKIKEEIESNLQNGNLQKSIDILNAYEQENPRDRDLKFYKCICMLQIGDIEKAKMCIRDSHRIKLSIPMWAGIFQNLFILKKRRKL